jgi:hypothetical protein
MEVCGSEKLWVAACSGVSHFPASSQSRSLRTSERTTAHAAVDNFLATAHTCSGLTHPCSIGVAGKLGKKVYTYSKKYEGNFGTISQEKK